MISHTFLPKSSPQEARQYFLSLSSVEKDCSDCWTKVSADHLKRILRKLRIYPLVYLESPRFTNHCDCVQTDCVVLGRCVTVQELHVYMRPASQSVGRGSDVSAVISKLVNLLSSHIWVDTRFLPTRATNNEYLGRQMFKLTLARQNSDTGHSSVQRQLCAQMDAARGRTHSRAGTRTHTRNRSSQP